MRGIEDLGLYPSPIYRQGLHYYASIPAMRSERFKPLMARFVELLSSRPVFTLALGLL